MSQRRINFAVAVAYLADEATLIVAGDATSSPEVLERQLQDLVARRPARVLLDLSEMEHLSSIGLGVILSLRRAVVGYGGEVRIGRAQAAVWEVFRRTGVDVLFYPSGPALSLSKGLALSRQLNKHIDVGSGSGFSS